MTAVPDHPTKRHARIRFAPFPSRSVHHGEAFAKTMDSRQAAILKDVAPPLALVEGQPHQHDHERADFDSVRDELLGQLVRWIGNDALTSARQLLPEEI